PAGAGRRAAAAPARDERPDPASHDVERASGLRLQASGFGFGVRSGSDPDPEARGPRPEAPSATCARPEAFLSIRVRRGGTGPSKLSRLRPCAGTSYSSSISELSTHS